jgi:hypothetical protein
MSHAFLSLFLQRAAKRVMLGSFALWCVTCLCGSPSYAGEEDAGHGASGSSSFWSEHFELSVFGTLGVVRGGDDQLTFRRDWSSPGVTPHEWEWKADSLLGLQLDARLTENLEAAAQIVLKDRVDDQLEKSLEMAFLRYRLTPSLTLRGGRVGVDMFMLSEFRNIGFAYLWARPVNEFYNPVAFAYTDGADVSYSRYIGEGVLQTRIFGGKMDNVLTLGLGEVELGLAPVWGVNLSYEWRGWKTRLSYADTKIRDNIEPVMELRNALGNVDPALWPGVDERAALLESEGDHVRYYSVGLSYDSSTWTVLAEACHIDSEFHGFRSLSSGYASVGRHIGPVTLYTVYALAKTQEDAISVPEPQVPAPALMQLHAAAEDYFQRNLIDQRTLSFGARWDIWANWALKIQWDHAWVDAFGGGLWMQQSILYEDREIDIFSANLNFAF